MVGVGRNLGQICLTRRPLEPDILPLTAVLSQQLWAKAKQHIDIFAPGGYPSLPAMFLPLTWQQTVLYSKV
ncbi:hypothetical protein ABEF92_001236 [Exophiala dermatitidis]|uniref:Uncharacterized protein n=1 Tax=Exophiala dermatitidis (strain ATCC 34100 / CBS 525.76 / NIH/UT8656) TaxID=858893 RepID=H6BTR4_EXODN|nr:uncharacterized protein HMPREF1120_03625 [Exophiala dermatitidis NIH/UT8656]EHY55491.1 hypothetical protein HMPREF1120_03625 [Exophiala dermatitidis NIH/UT8656]